MGWFDSMVGAGRGFAGRQSSTPYSTGRQSAAGAYGQRQSPTGGYSPGFGGATPYGMNRQSSTPYPYSGGGGGGGTLGKIGGALFGGSGYSKPQQSGGYAQQAGYGQAAEGMTGWGEVHQAQPAVHAYAQPGMSGWDASVYGQAQPVAQPDPATARYGNTEPRPTDLPPEMMPPQQGWRDTMPRIMGQEEEDAMHASFGATPEQIAQYRADNERYFKEWTSGGHEPSWKPERPWMPPMQQPARMEDPNYQYQMPDGRKVPYIPISDPYKTQGGELKQGPFITPEVNPNDPTLHGGGRMIAPGDPGWQQLDDKRPTLGGIQGGGLTEMESPDGAKRRLPPNQVPFYRGRGAREV